MVSIVTRQTGASAKNAALTNAEMDANFIALAEAIEARITNTVSSLTPAGGTLSIGGNLTVTGNTEVGGTFGLGVTPSLTSMAVRQTTLYGLSLSTAAQEYTMRIESAAGNALVIGNRTTSTDLLTLSSSGNLSGTGALTVAGAGSFGGNLSVVGGGTITGPTVLSHSTSDTNSAEIRNTHATGYGAFFRGGSSTRYAASFVDYSAGNQLMLLSGTGALTVAQGGTFGGNLGIGTTSPDRRLVVNGDLGFSYSSTVSANGMRLSGVASEYFNAITGTATAIIHNFTSSSGASRFAITDGGNALIGAGAAINLYSGSSTGLSVLAAGSNAANLTVRSSNAQSTTGEIAAAYGANAVGILAYGATGRPALKFYQVTGGAYVESMTLDESANCLIGRTTNPKGAKLAIEGDLAVHGGNTRITPKYTGSSGIGASNTWVTVVDLSTLQTGGFAARVRCYGYENGPNNTSYCEYYVLHASSGWSIAAIGTKQTIGNDYGNMSLQISGSNLQVQNGAGAASAGTYNISLDIFEIA